MAALELGLNKGGKQKKIKLPVKKTLNLAKAVEGEKINWLIAVPLIILICLLAALVGKVAVVDRYAKLQAIQNENSAIRQRNESYEKIIAEAEEVKGQYAHYTYTGMTSEEKNRADRLAVLELVDEYIRPYADVSSMSVYDNTLTVSCSEVTLLKVKEIVADLEENERVNFCHVNTAKSTDDDDMVSAQIVIYLTGEMDLLEEGD